MQPKVSVIIPVYNVEKYLRQCLDSVVNQTLKDIEIICVDDGSTDNSGKILDEYAEKDNRIKVIHKKNEGYGKAMNVGFDNANGEYLGIVEPDDYVSLNMYEDLFSIAKQYNSDIVKSCFYKNLQFYGKTKIKKEKFLNVIPENRSFTIKEYPYFLRYHPSVWSCIYKKFFIEKNNIQFVEAAGAGWTDNPFQVQVLCLAERINYTSKAYYYWRTLYINASDALKDYSLPFKRCDEIHNWLEKSSIHDENILANLYKREFAYIGNILGMKTFSNKEDCYNRIQLMCQRMNRKIVLNNNQITAREKRVYFRCLKNPDRARLFFMLGRYLNYLKL